MHKNKRKAFTITEVIIASTLLVVVLGAGYQIFFGVSRGFRRGTKSLAMQNKMRNGLNLVREEMQRASYHSEVKISGTTITEKGYEFYVAKGNSDNSFLADKKAQNAKTRDVVFKADDNAKTIAKWSICKPFSDGSGAVFEASLTFTGTDLFYSRKLVKGSDSEQELINYKVLTDIAAIGFVVADFETGVTGGAAHENGCLLTIETFAESDQHNEPDLTTSAETGAKIEVKLIRNASI